MSSPSRNDPRGYEYSRHGVGASSADLTALTSRVAALEAASPPTAEVAGAALAAGTSVYRASTGRMLAEDGSYGALRDAFAGFTTASAAGAGASVNVAGNRDIATGLSGIVVGTGYYVSAGVIIAESALVTWLNTATSLVWYRFVGTGLSSTSIKQAWGEPQQVP